jgi:hypothetical protein
VAQIIDELLHSSGHHLFLRIVPLVWARIHACPATCCHRTLTPYPLCCAKPYCGCCCSSSSIILSRVTCSIIHMHGTALICVQSGQQPRHLLPCTADSLYCTGTLQAYVTASVVKSKTILHLSHEATCLEGPVTHLCDHRGGSNASDRGITLDHQLHWCVIQACWPPATSTTHILCPAGDCPNRELFQLHVHSAVCLRLLLYVHSRRCNPALQSRLVKNAYMLSTAQLMCNMPA